jgi:hypothetical protein
VRQRGLHRPPGGPHCGVERPGEDLVRLLLQQDFGARCERIVDQGVEAAERLDRCANRGFDAGLVADVRRQEPGAPAFSSSSAIITAAPSRTNRNAIPLPIPAPAPVISATFPSSRPMFDPSPAMFASKFYRPIRNTSRPKENSDIRTSF